jgi:hypothetical protein
MKTMIQDSNHWIMPFIRQIRQIEYFSDFKDEVMADFMFIANVRINPDDDDYAGMSSKQFFALIKQLPGYDGAVKRRFIREYELSKKKQQQKIAGLKKPNGDYNWTLLAKMSNGGKGLEMGSDPNE